MPPFQNTPDVGIIFVLSYPVRSPGYPHSCDCPTSMNDEAHPYGCLYRSNDIAFFVLEVTEHEDPAHRFVFASPYTSSPVFPAFHPPLSARAQNQQHRGYPMPPDAAADILTLCPLCLKKRQSITYEALVTQDGSDTTWLTILEPFENEYGLIDRIVGTSINITERRTIASDGTEETDEVHRYLQWLRSLHRLSTSPYDSLETLLQDYLKTGSAFFDLPLGILSAIDGSTYTVIQAHAPGGKVKTGDVFELGKTLCAEVVRQQQTVHYHHIGTQEALCRHPVYVAMKLEAYISTPLFVGGRLYGTLNFSSTEPRSNLFSALDIELIELMAEGIGRFLERAQAQTTLRHAKEHAEKAQQAAEEANRIKQGLLALMNHEIRSPLAAILGYANLLSEMDLSPEAQEFMGHIRLNGETLLTLINEVLDFSYIEAGQHALHADPFDFRRTLEEVVELIQPTISSQLKGVVCAVAPDVPDQMIGDEARVRQILMNLLSTAIKFATSGAVAVTVARQTGRGRAPRLHLQVHNDGKGIPLETLDYLFNAFNQSNSALAVQYGGIGLGLTISRRLVHLMGGDLWIESTEGVGSTFHLVLPTRLRTGTMNAISQHLEQVLS